MSNISDFNIKNGKLIKFYGRGGDVVIPSGVTSIGKSAFESCSHLTSITIPDSVTSIGKSAFESCSHLTSITIPDSVTSIGAYAFFYCRNLTSITIPNSVTSIGDEAFFFCSSLTSITIPDSVTSIGAYAFYDCSSLTSITIPNSVTSIGAYAFYDCSSLTSITIPNSVTSIGDEAFFYCSSLTSITIPNSVTSIGKSAFEGCSHLTSITIPDSVTSIGGSVFARCGDVFDITLPSALAKQLNKFVPETKGLTVHVEDISNVSAKFRPAAANGFAKDNRDCTDENGKKYLKYIKANAVKLSELAVEYPQLFHLMLREKLIAAKDLEAVTSTVQKSGNAELIAAILNYGNGSVSESDKAKVRQMKNKREETVTNFVFDTENLALLSKKKFAVTGKLKTFSGRDELRECLEACNATLVEKLDKSVHYLITNTPDSGTAKNKEAIELKIKRITEAQFNKMIGRNIQ